MAGKRRRQNDDEDAGPDQNFSFNADSSKAAELASKMRSLNESFFEWIRDQHESCPGTLWTQAAKEYIEYADDLVAEFKSTIDHLAGDPGGSGATRPAKRRETMTPARADLRGNSALSPDGLLPTAGSNLAAAEPPFSLGTTPQTSSRSSAAALFGSNAATAAGGNSLATSAPLFGAASAAGPLFGSTSTSAGLSSVSSTASLASSAGTWGAALASSPPASSGALFASAAASSAAAASADFSFFPSSTTAAAAAASAPSGSSSSAPMFGSASAAAASFKPLFGGASLGAGSSTPMFGAASLAASSAAPMFGTASPASSGSAPLSPGAAPAGSNSSGGFGGVSFAGGLFGTGSAGAAASGSLFGSAGANGGSIFGTVGAQSTTNSFAALAGDAADGSTGEAAEQEEAEEEKTKKVDLKGSDSTDIEFSGMSKMVHLGTDKAWGDAVTGTLTVRKDVPSGKFWIQVNSNQGRILRYAGLGDATKVTRKDVPGKDGKPASTCTFVLPLQVFEQPPDSSNPSPPVSVKATQVRVNVAKADDLQKGLVAAGCVFS